MRKFINETELKNIKLVFKGQVRGGEGPKDPEVWFSNLKGRLPSIGEKIELLINNLGTAVVRGYFVEDNYLGVACKLDSPPQWWVRQNGNDNKLVGAFGTEILYK